METDVLQELCYQVIIHSELDQKLFIEKGREFRFASGLGT